MFGNVPPSLRSRDDAGAHVVSLAERPELADQLPFGEGWPQFIFHDPVAKEYLDRVDAFFAELSLVLMDGAGAIIAGGWGVALHWDGKIDALPEGWDEAIARSVREHEEGVAPNTLCTMAAEVVRSHRRQGLETEVLAALRERARQDGLSRMIAPVRPTFKARYPLTPIERYMSWVRDDGAPLDPWLRSHTRLGAVPLTPAHRSMTIIGTVSEWEKWTGMRFPETGRYVVPDALEPSRSTVKMIAASTSIRASG
jgi:GNAT superfamily N-acetyltransferase